MIFVVFFLGFGNVGLFSIRDAFHVGGQGPCRRAVTNLEMIPCLTWHSSNSATDLKGSPRLCSTTARLLIFQFELGRDLQDPTTSYATIYPALGSVHHDANTRIEVFQSPQV
jgi:hypothetical protein